MWPRKWLTLSSILLLLAESGKHHFPCFTNASMYAKTKVLTAAAGIAAVIVYSPAFLKSDLEHFTLMLKIFMITSLATNLFVPVLTAARIWFVSMFVFSQMVLVLTILLAPYVGAPMIQVVFPVHPQTGGLTISPYHSPHSRLWYHHYNSQDL